MITATCGHEVESGISASVDEGQYVLNSNGESITAVSYGVYCLPCIKRFYNEGRLLSEEIKTILAESLKYKAVAKKYKEIAKQQEELHDHYKKSYEDEHKELAKYRQKLIRARSFFEELDAE